VRGESGGRPETERQRDRERDRERDRKREKEREVIRRGRVVKWIVYEISVRLELFSRASASFSAPTGPILLDLKLIGER
jgi:hypothetical protein